MNQYPEVSIVEFGTNEVIEQRKSDVPTQIVFDAIMKSGVVLTYKLHTAANFTAGAQPQKDEGRMPGLDWRIFGSKGEIRVTGYNMWSPNVRSEDMMVGLCEVNDGEVVTVDVGQDELKYLPVQVRNIAKLYEAFDSGANGDEGERQWYRDFEYALKKHKLIEGGISSNYWTIRP